MKTRTQKATFNIITSALYEIVALVCNLILPRLIILTYGSAYNGIVSSATQFLSFISILNLGVAGATRVALYKSLARNDTNSTSSIVKATEKHMRRVAFILVFFVVALSCLYPVFIDTGYSYFEVALLILAVGINSFGNYFFGAAYSAFLSAAQCVYIVNIFTIVTTIINTVLSVVLIKVGLPIQVVQLCSSIVFFMKPLFQRLYVSKKFAIDRHCKPDDTALAQRGEVMAHSIANIIHENTDIVILTIFCNVKLVSVYTVYNLVMNALKKMQTVFTNGTESIFGDMWAKGEIEKIKKNLELYEFFIMTLVSVVFSTATVMLIPFISLYTKRVTDIEYVLPVYAFTILTAQMFFSFRAPYVTLVQGIGHYKQTRNGAIAEATINIVLSIILVQIIGIVGVAIGTLVANIFRTNQYALYVDNNIIKRGKFTYIKKILVAITNVCIITVVLYHPISTFSSSWVSWIICAIIVFIISSIISVISSLVLFRGDFYELLKIGNRLLKRKIKHK